MLVLIFILGAVYAMRNTWTIRQQSGQNPNAHENPVHRISIANLSFMLSIPFKSQLNFRYQMNPPSLWANHPRQKIKIKHTNLANLRTKNVIVTIWIPLLPLVMLFKIGIMTIVSVINNTPEKFWEQLFTTHTKWGLLHW